MSNCLQPDCNPDIPVPTPVPLPPCPDGESCNEVVDAACVVYTDVPLPAVNVLTNDRLEDIIKKWALGVVAGTQAITTGPTVTAIPSGNGTGLAPLMVDVQVSTLPSNLLKVVDYVDDIDTHRIGLEVTITVETIAWILTQIQQDEGLNMQFCELVRPCLATSCNFATDLVVEPYEIVMPNE